MSASDGVARSAPPAERGRGFPCAQCGAALAFEPESGRLLCAHCGHAQPVEDGAGASGPWDRARALAEIDYVRALAHQIDAAETEERRALHCDACGAETLLAEATTAGACAFCAAPMVGDPSPRRQFKPRAMAPFLVSERAARAKLVGWLTGLWFAPGDLGRLARTGQPFVGVYVPYWTFDAATRSSYSGERGDAYYEQVSVPVTKAGRTTMERRSVRKIRWRPVSGRVARAFDDLLTRASRSLPDGLARRLDDGGWDLSALEPWRAGYLAGFSAEAYTVDLEEGYAAARAIMDWRIRSDVTADIGGDAQRIRRVDTEVSDVTFKHVLLPVWIAAYRYRGKPYRVLVNGRTGRIHGERPFSVWKIAATGLALSTIAVLVVWMLAEAGAFE